MQKNVRKSIEKCYSEGITQESAVAYILIHHCICELTPHNPKKHLEKDVKKVYEEHSQHRHKF